ncbi:hypothetical protein [Mesorhizobium sp. M4B.F.Ca.ET.058.02.1.1]|uniref:hypothetical protein n=1 Tax=Mesorhizobium sp. M4B.F.Ca.ET.058.02.1.1 TaxID=2493675 RepID=UPI000F754B3E|nr:hypothetical protein [Mesorhizobium sp. M4B.F.Ca.ET.058.02.1.1]AZO51250.1 hypothetical protein EJ073_28635 [Mesorhizobium sp. M4B.F.Ca.ET.058.02.1.1]
MAFTAFQTNAFQNNAFQTIEQIPSYRGDILPGGYYRKPTKYVRDGKVVDLEPSPAPIVEPVEWPALSPEILAALHAGFQAPPIAVPDAAALERRLGRMVIDREMAAMIDDDDAVLLLL